MPPELVHSDDRNRLAELHVASDLLLLLVGGHWNPNARCIANALPEDAEVRGVRFGWGEHLDNPTRLVLVLRSRSFRALGPGEAIPVLEPPIFSDTAPDGTL